MRSPSTAGDVLERVKSRAKRCSGVTVSVKTCVIYSTSWNGVSSNHVR